MEATAKNEKIARTIINVLAESGCTVKEAANILGYVTANILRTSAVQKIDEKLFEVEEN